MNGSASVTFLPAGVRGDVPLGTTIAEAARRLGLRVETPCSSGSCGRDVVQIRIGPRLTNVLACAATVEGDLEVILPSAETEKLQAVTEFHGGEAASSATRSGRCAVALDVGTTTLAAALVDTGTGQVLARAAALNPLVTYGHDVVSRIRHAAAHRHGLRTMQRDLVAAVDLLLGLLVREAEAPPPCGLVAAGNTTMQHILLGLSIDGLGEFPYTAQTLDEVRTPAARLGLAIAGDVTTFPCIDAYVGGDIVAGLVAVGDLPSPALFLDVGTNGEIVLATDRGLVASSTAAGPCFEGMTISCGMRAADGAIQHVALADDVVLDVIGGGPPRGVCGSGLLDAVAELRRVGVLDARGRMASPSAAPEPWCARISDVEGRRRFRLADGVTLTQEDVRQVQLAKAAIRAGVETLLASEGLVAADLRRVVVAGAFGRHLSEASVFGVGMLPRLPRAELSFVGNASLEGAVRALRDEGVLPRAARLARAARSLDLSQVPTFERAFFREMAL